MPSRFSFKAGKRLKSIKLTALLLFLPAVFFGQSLTGLWTGALSNDSTTVRKDQLFEIALTEYRGKVYGYSRSEFIVNDTLYYIVKRVKGTINGDICEVTDDEILAYNFRGKLDKGIKVTSTFKRNGSDSAWYLAGTWKTNATKKYYSVTGKVDLGQEKDLTASKIFPHLEELKIADDIAFYKERNELPVVAAIAKPQRVKTEYRFSTDPAPSLSVAAPELVRTDPDPVAPEIKKSENDLARTKTNAIHNSSSNISVQAPELVRTDPEAPEPDLKKPEQSLSKTEPRTIRSGASSINVPAPELVRTDPDPVLPDIKKADAVTRTNTKVPAANQAVVQPAVSNKNTAVQTREPVTQTEKTNAVAATTVAKSNPSNPTGSIPATATAKNNNPPTETANTVSSNKNTVARNNTKPVNSNPVTSQSVPAPKDQATDISNTRKAQPAVAVQNIAAVNTTPAAPIVAVPKKSIEELTKNVATISGRKSEFSQVVDFKSDSLMFSLYDNGEIDGDTVSVIMNGETIMAKQGLKASAIRKTIYIQPGQTEDFTLVLFADNLGKYPPNTGLLVVHDGEDVYHLRFSSDFQKSTGIVFRRKK